MNKTIKNLINVFKKLYKPECALNYKKPVDLVVATILSAQCTDKRVNIVTKDLFKKYKSFKDYAETDKKILEQDIKSTGFYKNKSKNIINMAKTIVSEYNSKLPKNIDELVKLPGIGRKTANVVLGTLYNIKSGIVVDTHVKRLSYRIGLTKQKNPVIIERELMEIVPEKYWIDFSHYLILHGRAVCKARKPDCMNCKIKIYCDRNGVKNEN